MGEALLPGIEVDGRDALAGPHQGNGDMDGKRRFTRAALFIANNNNVCRLVGILVRLDQHNAALTLYASTYAQLDCPQKLIDCPLQKMTRRVSRPGPAHPAHPARPSRL
jgi:hypothetical protein